jgi:hypothetical protein
MNTCTYCKKEFKTPQTLSSHLKRSKKCLISRGNDIKSKFNCKYCEYSSMTSNDLQRHQKICKNSKIIEKEKEITNYFENKIIQLQQELSSTNIQLKSCQKELDDKISIIKELKEQNIKLQNDIKELAEMAINKSTTTNNTINSNNNSQNIENNVKMNMIPYENLTDKYINNAILNELDEDFFLEGQKGIAKFVGQCLLTAIDEKGDRKKFMVCTDPSRKMFKTINNTGEVSKDIDAKKLTERIYEPVKNRSDVITKEINDKYYYLVENTSDDLEDMDKEKIEIDVASEKLTKALESKTEIYKLKKDNSEFSKELAKILA